MLKTLTPTETLSRDDWLQYRNRGIGGSDVAIICGLSKYKSVFQLWAEKTGYREDEPENEYMYWGKTLEPIIRAEFIKRTGLTVTTCPAILQHPEYPFMLANIDGIVSTNEGNFIFEAKTASAYLIDEWNTENYVPYPYMLQIQHYMAVTGLQGAYIACLIGGNHFCYKFIKRDEKMIKMMIMLEMDFWNYVECNTPPPVDGSESAKEYLNSLYPSGKSGESVTLDESCIKLIEDYENNELQEKHFKELKEKSANDLKLLLGDNESAKICGRIITWKNVSQERLDSKRLATEMPDIYAQYLNQSSYRRFQIKSKKGG